MPLPISNLEQQFSSLSTEDKVENKPSTANSAAAPALVTPTKEDLPDADSLTSDDSLDTPTKVLVQKTDHKLAEENGNLVAEPLLQENPHRFVLFPIQDNDVSNSWKGHWNEPCQCHHCMLTIPLLST
jgi:hypothetical protein